MICSCGWAFLQCFDYVGCAASRTSVL